MSNHKRPKILRFSLKRLTTQEMRMFGGTGTGMMSKEFGQIFANLFWEWDDPPVQQQS